MQMDFFTAQDHARRNTGLLVVLFVLAVVSLICVTDLFIVILYGLKGSRNESIGLLARVNWEVVFWASVAVFLVVISGTWYKLRALSGGGDAVALMMGGEPVFPDDDDLKYKQLINVVEEMALASGIPMPQVYVLPERGINAFAAGLTTSDAIVAVTQGALDHFNRDQLQGVIAHEFSHILNGDMRLNVRLIGILHGILVIGLIGQFLLRGRSHRSNDRGALLLGLGLLIIGYTGVFFGNLIKAAVSRQREFLADASAVQFTRNVDGLAGALMIIGAEKQGGILSHRRSDEVSHALFSQGVQNSLSSPFATHPPLSQRIKRILPSWDGRYTKSHGSFNQRMSERVSRAAGSGVTSGLHNGSDEADKVISVGRPTSDLSPGSMHMQSGKSLLQQISPVIRMAAHDPFAARAVIILLVLDTNETARQRQLDILEKEANDRGLHTEVRRLLQQNGLLPRKIQLAVLELTLPSLRRLSEQQAYGFKEILDNVIREDNKVTLFEWCLQRIVVEHLHEFFGWSFNGKATFEGTQVGACVGMLFSVLCYAASRDAEEQQVLFTRAANHMNMPHLTMSDRKLLSLPRIDAAFHTLRAFSPRKKQRLFLACKDIVLADGEVTTVEGELLRVVAATLSIPMPPM